MQSLYSFFMSGSDDISKGEREMLRSIDKVYDLYIYLLLLLIEINDFARIKSEENKLKRLPTKDDLAPNTRFIENSFIKKLAAERALLRESMNRKLGWQNDREIVKIIYNETIKSSSYIGYLNSGDNTFASEKGYIIKLFKKQIAENEHLRSILEEKSIYWTNDIDFVNGMVIKTIKSYAENNADDNDPAHTGFLFPLWKDEEDDRNFVIDLFRKTVLHSMEYEKLIAAKTENWEMDRISMMDVLLMKMALTEFQYFPSLPVKVSINEYIEIAKEFSTEQSGTFINGILDKLLEDLRNKDMVQKTGKGLL